MLLFRIPDLVASYLLEASYLSEACVLTIRGRTCFVVCMLDGGLYRVEATGPVRSRFLFAWSEKVEGSRSEPVGSS